jgi:Tfp pilus assembly protein PilN
MINLLPSSVKEQMQFARYNRLALRYLRVCIAVVVVLAAVFSASIFFLDQQATTVAHDITEKQKQIDGYAPDVKAAKEAADRLAAIKGIQTSQTRFSLLLDDIAKVLPKGVSIDSITLTGDDKKPVRISVTGGSYDSMLAFREAMASSSRISGVDLENITQAGSIFQSSVVIGFKPGQAR